MHDDAYRPFEGLSKRLGEDKPAARKTPAKARSEPEPRAPEPEGPDTDDTDMDDAELFLRAVAGVGPGGTPGGTSGGKDESAGPDGLTHTPLSRLAKAKKKRKKDKKGAAKAAAPEAREAIPETPPEAPAEPPLADAEENAFLRAMADVEPLAGSGRDRPAAPEPPAAPRPSENPDDYVRRKLEQLVDGEVVFDCSLTDEFAAGQVRGLDPRIFNKLKAGSYAVEAHLDLHGLTLEPAWHEVTEFIRRQYTLGRRCLLLVTGRGLNSPDGRGVLREQVQSWLTREPLRRVVLAFVTAQPRHGGAGALYVLLRKRRKSGGKVRWDRMPPDIDLP